MENTSIPISRPQSAQQAAFIPASDVPAKQTFPTEFIDLPSRGHFYPEGSALASGRVELKFMTAKEEDILTSQNLIKKGIVLDELLKALIVNPAIKLDDILIGDKNAIFVAARRLAYGDKYPAKITCKDCGEESEVQINLGVLDAKPFDFEKAPKGKNEFDFQLPTSKKNVVYRLLTHKDEADIDAELKIVAKKVGGNGSSPEMTTRLKYLIVSIDGNADRNFIKKFVDTELRAIDSVELRKHIRGNNPDMDMNFDFTCPKCSATARMAMPLGVDFFWPAE
jgi:hypothetical protein